MERERGEREERFSMSWRIKSAFKFSTRVGFEPAISGKDSKSFGRLWAIESGERRGKRERGRRRRREGGNANSPLRFLKLSKPTTLFWVFSRFEDLLVGHWLNMIVLNKPNDVFLLLATLSSPYKLS